MVNNTRYFVGFLILLFVLFELVLLSDWRLAEQALASVTHQDEVICEEVVIVQTGDWLSKLAKKFYGDMLAYPAIVEATNAKAAIDDDGFPTIEDPNIILPGWKLCIPSAEQAQAFLAAGSSATAPMPTPSEFPSPTPTQMPTDTSTPTPAGQIVTLAAGGTLELIGRNETNELLLVADPAQEDKALGWIENDSANFSKPPDLDDVPIIPAPPLPAAEETPTPVKPTPVPTPTAQPAATPVPEPSFDTGQVTAKYLKRMIVDQPGVVTLEIKPEQLLASLGNVDIGTIPSVIGIEENSGDEFRDTFQKTILLFPVMEAKLIAPKFDIYSADGDDARRSITPQIRQATWTWHVTPRTAGEEQIITIEIFGWINEDTLKVKVLSETRNVDVEEKPLGGRVLDWLGDNILTILSTSGPLALLIAFLMFQATRKSNELEQTIKELQEKL